MDFITHLPMTVRKHDMCMVVVDTLSKMAHFIPCNMHDKAEDIARYYMHEVFRLHGWPERLITDRDTKFTDAFFKAFCAQLGIRQGLSSAHHPETDGQTERMNRVLEETLRHWISDKMDNWDELLPAAEFAINNSFQTSVQTTPFHFNYGYHPKVPLHVGVSPHPDVNDFLEQHHNVFLSAGRYFAFAQQRLHADYIAALTEHARLCYVHSRHKQQQYANNKRSLLTFTPGQQCMLKTKNLNLRHWPAKKLFPLWLGPFEIDSQCGKVSYRLVLPAHWPIHDVFHVNLLKPYRDNGQDHPPSPFNYLHGQEFEYEVERIIAHKPADIPVQKGYPIRVLRKMTFLVRWKYSTAEHDSWEPHENLRHAPESLVAYGL